MTMEDVIGCTFLKDHYGCRTQSRLTCESFWGLLMGFSLGASSHVCWGHPCCEAEGAIAPLAPRPSLHFWAPSSLSGSGTPGLQKPDGVQRPSGEV